MGRPHTFAGGAIAWPMYVPYELYGRVDPVYSTEAYYSGLGWTGAQGLGNVFETLAYFAYMYVVIAYGRDEGRGNGLVGSLGAIGRTRKVEGYWGVIASLLGYTTFMVTIAKSVLYCELWRRLVGEYRITNTLQGTTTPSWGFPFSSSTAGSISSSSLPFLSMFQRFVYDLVKLERS